MSKYELHKTVGNTQFVFSKMYCFAVKLTKEEMLNFAPTEDLKLLNK
jgi:hypothetical protein